MNSWAAASFLVLGLVVQSALTAPVDFTECVSDAGEGRFNVTEILLEPDQPEPGDTLKIQVRGDYDGPNVTAGEVQLVVSDVPFIGNFETTFDVCELADCPLGTGIFEFETQQELPSFTPAQEYGVSLVAVDKTEGREERTLLCIDTSVTVSGGGGGSLLASIFGRR